MMTVPSKSASLILCIADHSIYTRTRDFLTTLRSTFSALSTLPVPTISAVSSLALGGGFELALATDLRVFGTTASVGLPETRIGIIPGAGGTYRLQQLCGKSTAMAMILTGLKFDGRSARRESICESIVTVDPEASGAEARSAVLETAVQVARDICDGAPVAIGAAIRAVREGSEHAEGKEYEGLLGTEDRGEALRAFKEKREAVFMGR